MERTLTITNMTRGQLVLNLPAALVPELSRAAPTPPTDPVPRARRVGDRRVDLPGRSVPSTAPARLSGSVTLNARGTAGDTVKGLPPSTKRAPDVQAALRADPPRVKVDVVVVRTEAEQVQARARDHEQPPQRVPATQPPAPKGGAR